MRRAEHTGRTHGAGSARRAAGARITLPAALITLLAALITLALNGAGAPAGASILRGSGSVPAAPLMGWSSWSSLRGNVTLARVEREAAALKRSGLAALGYDYVNVDDYWYVCGSKLGPAVDRYGRWVVDPRKFPGDPATGENGIQVLAGYLHRRGLKLGLYVTPGVPHQAVVDDTPILGTRYRADQIIAHGANSERNYNACGAALPVTPDERSDPASAIDYGAPGAQAFVDSWADEFAAWGVDYVKLDGVGDDLPDIRAWSAAVHQSGRQMRLELANRLALAQAPRYRDYASGWRTTNDIEQEAPDGDAAGTLTAWPNVVQRLDAAAVWQPYGGAGAYNDYDAIEVGNGAHDGLTRPQRASQISLWALAASPLLLGADLTDLDPADLRLLKDPGVLSVDRDGIDATRIVDDGAAQVFAKTEPDGSVVIGLFNADAGQRHTVSVNLRAAGVTAPVTRAVNLWDGSPVGPLRGTYSVQLAPGAVQLLRTMPGAGGPGIERLAWRDGSRLGGQAWVGHCDPSGGAGPCAFPGGGFVSGLGPAAANAVTIPRIRVPSSGSYLLDVGYGVAGQATLTVSVDGGPPQQTRLSGSGLAAPGTASLLVRLRRGTNTLRFHSPDSAGLALDNVTVTPLGG